MFAGVALDPCLDHGLINIGGMNLLRALGPLFQFF